MALENPRRFVATFEGQGGHAYLFVARIDELTSAAG
jgi:hypothetical protein